MKEPKRTMLWSAAGQQANNTSIELTDSIDNYDELWFYGSGTRTYTPCVITEYPVIPGVVNLGGPFFVGKWGATDTFALCNGTQMFLSGNSGYVAASYYFGKGNGSTGWAAELVNNRANDVRPFKILGLKYQDDPNRATLWESTGVNLYNQNISLNEHITHYNSFELYSSGFEDGGNGCRHAGKNIYQSQPKLINCGSWAYTPWKYAERHNLLIGDELLISGNSGHIRSGYYWGMGNNTTAYAAGKWNSDYALSALQPYKIVGIDHKPILNVNLNPGEHGTLSSNVSTGCEYDYVNLSATPNEGYFFSGYNLTGATATGNQFMFNNTDVIVNAVWAGPEDVRHLTLQNDGHGTLAASKLSGLAGETASLTPTNASNYIFSGFTVTGATIANSALTFGEQDCTAKAWFKYGWNYRPMTTWTKASKSNNTLIITNNRVQIKGVANWNELLYRTFSTTAAGTYKLSMDWTAPNGLTFWSKTASYRNCGLWVSTTLTASKTNSYEGPTGTGILMQNSNNTSKITKSQTANISIQANKTYYLWFSFGTLADGVSNMYIDFNKLTFEKV